MEIEHWFDQLCDTTSSPISYQTIVTFPSLAWPQQKLDSWRNSPKWIHRWRQLRENFVVGGPFIYYRPHFTYIPGKSDSGVHPLQIPFFGKRKLQLIILRIAKVLKVIDSRVGINLSLNRELDWIESVPSMWNRKSTLSILEPNRPVSKTGDVIFFKIFFLKNS